MLTRFWEWLTHDGASFFTAVLCLIASIQAGLFVWQLLYMKWGLRDTKITAEAARDAAIAQKDQFLASNRPKIRIKHVWFTGNFQPEASLTARVECVNVGTTEGIITEFGIIFLPIDKDKFLPFPNPTIPKIEWPETARIECGLTYRLPDAPDAIFLTRAQYESIRSGETRLFCIGYLRYLDQAKRLRSTGLCRVLTFPERPDFDDNGRFRVVEDSDYEYED
jgi:hypothetical protein